MKNPILFMFFVLSLISCSNGAETKAKSKIDAIKTFKQEEGYPWTVDITEVAIQAIHRSIKNLDKPENERDENFPANPYGVPFSQSEIEDFEIIGYSTSTSSSNIYQISFCPKDEMIEQPSITVEINVKTKKPIRVYMTPDA